MAKEKNNNIFLIIIVIIGIIIIYVATLGIVNFVQRNKEVQQEEEKKLSKLKYNHQKLKALIEKK